ncbi:hypothetical protein VaNZ11_011115, partial [Volvox africanus]
LSAMAPVDKLMSSRRLAPTLNCVKAVLHACSKHERLDSDAWVLAHSTWALSVRILEQGLPAFRDRLECRSGLVPLVVLLPICWFYLRHVFPEGRAPTPRLMRAWLPAALSWLPALSGVSGGPMGTCAALLCSLENIIPTVRDIGPIEQDVLAAVREVLSQRHEAFDGELRLRLAKLFPEATLGVGSFSTHPAHVRQPKAWRSDQNTCRHVVDLTLSDDDEAEEAEEQEEPAEEEPEEEGDDERVEVDVSEMFQGLEWETEEGMPAAGGAVEEEVVQEGDARNGGFCVDKAPQDEDCAGSAGRPNPRASTLSPGSPG